eukprot:TRINITY_DN1427_c0_g1_i1.p1 TRINITY_DN1427_c0_g1~~TRINITY_DN1427_c0_g1_i1.p1  ORF type:complete len:405 (-),score=66.67 TRINITY_DN1427_c0_g1_i1:11-1225(-)
MGAANCKQVTQAEREQFDLKFEQECKNCADIIKESDFLLLHTGAGFSADSGLAVYKDIAKIEAYTQLNLDYKDLCVPKWLNEHPELFYGFWGKCFNDYRTTNPHEGYTILQKWKESYFNSSNVAKQVITQQEKRISQMTSAWNIGHYRNMVPNSPKQYSSTFYSSHHIESNLAGGFFIVTSNVDSHSRKSGFNPNEIYEIHGNTDLWQCAKPCCDTVWPAPSNHLFHVDQTTMLAPPNKPDDTESQPNTKEENMKGWESNHPKCIFCNKESRPAVVMYGDFACNCDELQSEQYDLWDTVVSKMIVESWENDSDEVIEEGTGEEDVKLKNKLKLVILEIGCGANVPTIRRQSEQTLQKLPAGSTTLIRINLDFPYPDNLTLLEASFVKSLCSSGLTAIKEINKHL